MANESKYSQTKEKTENRVRIGDILVKNKEGLYVPLINTAIGAYLISHYMPEFLKDYKNAIAFGKHISTTVTDIVAGGPKGYLAAKSLDERLDFLSTYIGDREVANSILYNNSREKELVDQMLKVYEENETIMQVSQRLKLQAEGLLKSTFNIGNSLKPKWWKEHVDKAIVNAYGKTGLFKFEDYESAMANSERLTDFFTQVKNFYDSKDKNESTIKDFCDYLSNANTNATLSNQKLELYFPTLTQRIKEGYKLEDYLIESDISNLDQLRVQNIELLNKEYESRVNKTREMVGKDVPLKEYKYPLWADVLANPILVAFAAAMIYKVAIRPFPKFVRKPFAVAMTAPIRYPLNLAHEGISRSYNTIKKRLKTKKPNDDLREGKND